MTERFHSALVALATVEGALETVADAVIGQDPLFGLPLATLWFVLVFAILGTFLLLDGFDFGAGILFALQSDPEERETILSAIGPFWDGNEVWLVVFGGALFAAFPRAYATLFSRHYLLMFAILGALVLRGLAPEMYEQRHDRRWQRVWGASFVVGSVAAPFLLGLFVAAWWLGTSTAISIPGVAVGLAVVALCVVDSIAFLGLKTRGAFRESLVDYWPRALAGYLSVVVLALATVALRPGWAGTLLAPIPVALVAVTLLSAAGYGLALASGRYRVAFVAVAGMVYALVGVVAVTLHPAIDPAVGTTVDEAVVGPISLNLLSVGAVVLIPLVVLYFATLYSAFGGPIEPGETY